jgi:hypothetical protein
MLESSVQELRTNLPTRPRRRYALHAGSTCVAVMAIADTAKIDILRQQNRRH